MTDLRSDVVLRVIAEARVENGSVLWNDACDWIARAIVEELAGVGRPGARVLLWDVYAKLCEAARKETERVQSTLRLSDVPPAIGPEASMGHPSEHRDTVAKAELGKDSL